VRAFHHLLGETGVSFFGTKPLARAYRRGFPGSLNGAPMLLPLENLTLRRSLNQGFERHAIEPRVVAEFEDGALLKVFGGDGVGIFTAPTVVEREVIRQYGVSLIGRTQQVKERFYAISGERRLKNAAVVAICDAAREKLFGDAGPARERRAS
jgi:LysR family transcriptional activator of nhaA